MVLFDDIFLHLRKKSKSQFLSCTVMPTKKGKLIIQNSERISCGTWWWAFNSNIFRQILLIDYFPQENYSWLTPWAPTPLARKHKRRVMNYPNRSLPDYISGCNDGADLDKIRPAGALVKHDVPVWGFWEFILVSSPFTLDGSGQGSGASPGKREVFCYTVNVEEASKDVFALLKRMQGCWSRLCFYT